MNTIKVIWIMIKKLLKIIMFIIRLIFTVPSIIRAKENKRHKDDIWDFIIGTYFMLVLILYGISLLFFGRVFNPFVIFHIITNSLSALYEWYRHEKNKFNKNKEKMNE